MTPPTAKAQPRRYGRLVDFRVASSSNSPEPPSNAPITMKSPKLQSTSLVNCIAAKGSSRMTAAPPQPATRSQFQIRSPPICVTIAIAHTPSHSGRHLAGRGVNGMSKG